MNGIKQFGRLTISVAEQLRKCAEMREAACNGAKCQGAMTGELAAFAGKQGTLAE
jgi:hypothetical protein